MRKRRTRRHAASDASADCDPCSHSIFLDFLLISAALSLSLLSVMDGVTATRLLRSRGFTLPIIGVTGNALEEDLEAFRHSGADEVLVRRRQNTERRSESACGCHTRHRLIQLFTLASSCGLLSSSSSSLCADEAGEYGEVGAHPPPVWWFCLARRLAASSAGASPRFG
jgi:CheY-like chemotaxis protein